MSPLLEFMKTAKESVSRSCDARLHVVLGNESCDLDSAVSALVYGFLLYSLQKEEEESEEGKKVAVVPVLNIPSADYPLKTEVTHWLAKHCIQQHTLVFRDEVDLTQLQRSRALQLTLVDHHVLPPADAHLDSSVTFILDHRPLDPQRRPCGEMVVEPVGSCCTLVAEHVLAKNPALLQDHPSTASLLYGTIVLDTVNFSPAAKRVTPKDVEMCERLLSRLTHPPPSSLEVFQELTEAKGNVSALTCDELLRKDVKVVSGGGLTVGVVSVPMRVKDLLERCGADKTLADHSITRGYDCLVLLGLTLLQQTVRRDLAVFSLDHRLRSQLVTTLREAQGGVLQLVPQEWKDVGSSEAFLQGNTGASRKVVLPIVKEWLTATSSSSSSSS